MRQLENGPVSLAVITAQRQSKSIYVSDLLRSGHVSMMPLPPPGVQAPPLQQKYCFVQSASTKFESGGAKYKRKTQYILHLWEWPD